MTNLVSFKRKDGGGNISCYVKHNKLGTKKAPENFQLKVNCRLLAQGTILYVCQNLAEICVSFLPVIYVYAKQ